MEAAVLTAAGPLLTLPTALMICPLGVAVVLLLLLLPMWTRWRHLSAAAVAGGGALTPPWTLTLLSEASCTWAATAAAQRHPALQPLPVLVVAQPLRLLPLGGTPRLIAAATVKRVAEATRLLMTTVVAVLLRRLGLQS